MIKHLCIWTSLGLVVSACSPHVEPPPQPHTHSPASEVTAQLPQGSTDQAQQLTYLSAAVQKFSQDQTRFRYAFADLNQDGIQDAFVLLQSQDWCGSGGCTLLIFKGLADQSFQYISDSTVTDTPIYLLSSSQHGWRDFSVYTRGTGQVLMQFNGQKYPSNPSMLDKYEIQADQVTTSAASATAATIQPLELQLFDPEAVSK